MLSLTMDAGEYARPGIDFTGSPAPWDDLTGATVTLTARASPSSPIAFTANGTLDAAGVDGKVHSAGVVIPLTAPVGNYLLVTITVDKPGVEGWPQKETFRLAIRATA